MSRARPGAGAARVLIIVQNLPVPFDRRVWQEALALRAAGNAVTVVCPRTRRAPERYEVLDGVTIRRFWLPVEGAGEGVGRAKIRERFWMAAFRLHRSKRLVTCTDHLNEEKTRHNRNLVAHLMCFRERDFRCLTAPHHVEKTRPMDFFRRGL